MGTSLSARAIAADRLPERARAALARRRATTCSCSISPLAWASRRRRARWRPSWSARSAARSSSAWRRCARRSRSTRGSSPRRSTRCCRSSRRSTSGWSRASRAASNALWSHLSRRRRHRVWVDRFETCYALDRSDAHLVAVRARPHRARGARTATSSRSCTPRARACARRTGPIRSRATCAASGAGCAGAIPRARVVESAGAISFVGYADVQRGEGWLLQGVYTWPRRAPARLRGRGHLGALRRGVRLRRRPRAARRRRRQRRRAAPLRGPRLQAVRRACARFCSRRWANAAFATSSEEDDSWVCSTARWRS